MKEQIKLAILSGLAGVLTTTIGVLLVGEPKEPQVSVTNTVGRFEVVAVDVLVNGAQVIEFRDVTTGNEYLAFPGLGITKK